jgi:L-ascorbate 6-phosphate lactonase
MVNPEMTSLSMPGLRAHATPPGALTLWWLGQAGFILKSPAGKIVALDPYLSDSCGALGAELGFDMRRQQRAAAVAAH